MDEGSTNLDVVGAWTFLDPTGDIGDMMVDVGIDVNEGRSVASGVIDGFDAKADFKTGSMATPPEAVLPDG